MSVSRRRLLMGAVALGCGRLMGQNRLPGHGRVDPPRAVPEVAVTLPDGRRSTLRALVLGRLTAVQLMFTACTTTCPMEGAIFAKVQRMLPAEATARGAQLLSLSINPEGEQAGELSMWMANFQARAGWLAAATVQSDVARVRAFFGEGRGGNDPHTTQAQIVDRKGYLVWQTSELPSPGEVIAILTQA